jgi:N-methylhydantoinase A
VLIPPSPGIASARGLLTADVKYDNQVTISRNIAGVEAEAVERRFEDLERRGRDRLERDEIPTEEMTFRRSVDCLYDGQGYELNVEFDGTDGDWRQRIRDRFEEKHEADLNLRVSAIGNVSDYEAADIGSGGDAEAARTGEDTVVFGSSQDPEHLTVSRYDRGGLGAGDRIDGPAIVDQPDSTVVIKPDWSAEVLKNGVLSLTRK